MLFNLALRPAPPRNSAIAPPLPLQAIDQRQDIGALLRACGPPRSSVASNLAKPKRHSNTVRRRADTYMPFLSAANAHALGARGSVGNSFAVKSSPSIDAVPAVPPNSSINPSQTAKPEVAKINGHNLRKSARRDCGVGKTHSAVAFSNLTLRPAAVGVTSTAIRVGGQNKKQKQKREKKKGAQAHRELIKNIANGYVRETRTPTNRILAMLAKNGKLTDMGQNAIERNLFDCQLGYASFGPGLDNLTYATSAEYSQWRAGVYAVANDRLLRPALPVLLRAFFESFGSLYDQKRSMELEEIRGEQVQECDRTIAAMLCKFFEAARVDLVDALWEHFLAHSAV